MSKSIKDELRTFDIEAVGEYFGNKFKLGCIFDGQNYYYADTAEELYDKIKELGGIFYAHYASKFDFKFLLEYVLEENNKKFRLISTDLASIKLENVEMRDSRFIFGGLSLARIAESFTDERKMEVDRSKIDLLSAKELLEYVASDCRILYKAIVSFASKNGFKSIKKLPVSIPTLSFRKLREYIDYSYHPIKAKYDPVFREAYYGGRVDVFRMKGKNLYYYDVNSMYPYVMYSKEYPTGYVVSTTGYLEDKLGIYKVTVEINDKVFYPLLPYRLRGKLLFPVGKFTGWYTSPEVAKALMLGYKVKIHDGYIFLSSENVFKPFVNKYYNIKKNSTGPEREIAKLIMNSCYGKLAQRREFYDIVFDAKHDELVDCITLSNENMLYLKKVKDKRNYSFIHWGAFVTAYARLKLFSIFEEIVKKGGNVYYCDTDSVVTDVKLDTSDDLGGLKLEYEIKEGIFLAPKTYAVITKDGDTKLKGKGFDTSELTFEAYEKALNGDFSHFETSFYTMVGFFEAMRRDMYFCDVVERKRSLKSALNKRVVGDDYITYPLKITEELTKQEKDLNTITV